MTDQELSERLTMALDAHILRIERKQKSPGVFSDAPVPARAWENQLPHKTAPEARAIRVVSSAKMRWGTAAAVAAVFLLGIGALLLPTLLLRASSPQPGTSVSGEWENPGSKWIVSDFQDGNGTELPLRAYDQNPEAFQKLDPEAGALIQELFRWEYRVLIGDNAVEESDLDRLSSSNCDKERLQYFARIYKHNRELWENAQISISEYEMELVIRDLRMEGEMMIVSVYNHFSYRDRRYPQILTEEGELYEITVVREADGFKIQNVYRYGAE